MQNGLLITFEGGDGSGKTTQFEIFVERLRREEKRRVVVFREPGGTPTGEKLREIIKFEGACPKSELFMLAAARAELVNQVVVPALNSGFIIVGDRFTDSTLAYQGYGRGLDLSEVSQIVNISTGGISPDLTFLVDVDPEIAQARIALRGGRRDNFDLQELDFACRVKKGYLEIANEHPQRIIVVNGNENRERVSDAIYDRWAKERRHRFSLQVGEVCLESKTQARTIARKADVNLNINQREMAP